MIVAALAIVLLSSLLWLGRLRETHHGYYGLLLALAPWGPLRVTGLVLPADDALQHAVQVWYPAFRSPLHRAYGLLYRLRVVRRLNQWLDREMA